MPSVVAAACVCSCREPNNTATLSSAPTTRAVPHNLAPQRRMPPPTHHTVVDSVLECIASLLCSGRCRSILFARIQLRQRGLVAAGGAMAQARIARPAGGVSKLVCSRLSIGRGGSPISPRPTSSDRGRRKRGREPEFGLTSFVAPARLEMFRQSASIFARNYLNCQPFCGSMGGSWATTSTWKRHDLPR